MTTYDQRYFIGGANVGVYNDVTLVIEPFSAWMFGALAGIRNLTTTIYPDMRGIGLNGIDANPNGQGHMPPDGCYDIYLLCNPVSGDVGVICSLSASLGGVVLPTGYTLFRKLMYGVLIRSGKLVANHTANWPMPTVMLSTPILITSILSPSQAWVTLDLSKLTPENARWVWYRCVFTNAPCNCYVAPTASAQYQKLVAYNQLGSYSGIGCRIDGSQHGYAQLFNGGRADIYLDGWSQTEVS